MGNSMDFWALFYYYFFFFSPYRVRRARHGPQLFIITWFAHSCLLLPSPFVHTGQPMGLLLSHAPMHFFIARGSLSCLPFPYSHPFGLTSIDHGTRVVVLHFFIALASIKSCVCINTSQVPPTSFLLTPLPLSFKPQPNTLNRLNPSSLHNQITKYVAPSPRLCP